MPTKYDFAYEVARGSDVSVPKAARVIDYLISLGIQLNLSDVKNEEPGWGRIMEFPLYEISDAMEVRSYHTKKLIPVSDTGEVSLHHADGSIYRLNVKDLVN
jgi:hypothetical protein